MKKLKRIVLITLILVFAAFAASEVYLRTAVDRTAPVIRFDSDILLASVQSTHDQLLAGVRASDNRDGDLTGEILVSGVSKLISSNTASVTYHVFDHAGNMATATRMVEYTDYKKPSFRIDRPLIYNLGEAVTLDKHLAAADVIDGDLTNEVRIISMDITFNVEGVYSLTVQVTNSVGDTARLTLPLIIRSASSLVPEVELNDYLIYLKSGDSFTAESYLKQVKCPGTQDVSLSDVQIDGMVDPNTPGTYRVSYSYTSPSGWLGTAILTVVVE